MTCGAVLLSACAESETLKYYAPGVGGAAGSGSESGTGGAAGIDDNSGATANTSSGGSAMGGSAGEPSSGGTASEAGTAGAYGGSAGASGDGAGATGGAGNAGSGAAGSGAAGNGSSSGSSGSSGTGGSGGVAADSCPGQVVSFTGSGNIRTASVSGSTVNAFADLTGTCGSTGTGRDVVYAFTPDVDGRMLLTLSPQSGFDAVLYVREGTCTTNELDCEDSGGGGGAETLEVWVNQGVTYYVVVDGYSGAAGTFTLGATLEPVGPRDACPGEAVTWTGAGPYSWSTSGDTSVRADDLGGSGCGSTAGDVVFALTAPVTGLMSIDVSGSFDSEILFSTTCGGYDLACNDSAGASGTESFDVPVTQGTTYYLAIDGYSSSSEGSFSVSASVETAPAYDVCPGQDLTFNGTTATVNGSTAGAATHNYSGTCASGYSADAVFHFVAPQAGNAQITLHPGDSGYDSVLYVRSGSCTGAQLAGSVIYRDGDDPRYFSPRAGRSRRNRDARGRSNRWHRRGAQGRSGLRGADHRDGGQQRSRAERPYGLRLSPGADPA